MKNNKNWIHELPAAITVCNRKGKIISMNKKAQKTFEKYGGTALIGKNLLDCHPEPARSKLTAMLKKPASNSYTIEKNGIKKLIHQCPWYKKGKFMGLVEVSIEIPLEMNHFVRK